MINYKFKYFFIALFLYCSPLLCQPSDKKPMTFEAFNFYEKIKVDKSFAFWKSALVPGYGFSEIGAEDQGVVYFLLGAAAIYGAVSSNDKRASAAFYLGYVGLKVYEIVDLNSSIDYYNEKLRYQVQVKFNLQ